LAIQLPLTADRGHADMGTLYVKLSFDELDVPSWSGLLAIVTRPPPWFLRSIEELPTLGRAFVADYVIPIAQVTEWPRRAREVRRNNTQATVVVAVLNAKGVEAADFQFGTAGTSDPYARVTLGHRVQQTQVIKRSPNPKVAGGQDHARLPYRRWSRRT
jgi:hypothetical protein